MAERDRLQPGQPVAATGAARADRQLVADQSAAASGEDRRALDQARPLLLVAGGGEPSYVPAVWQHAEEDRDAAGASGIGAPRSAADLGDQIGGGRCLRTGLAEGHFWGLPGRETLKRPLPVPLGGSVDQTGQNLAEGGRLVYEVS